MAWTTCSIWATRSTCITTTSSCKAKIDYYLSHETERAAIAAAGQNRTLAEHTYLHRMRALMDVMSDSELAQAAPMRRAPADERWKAPAGIYTHLHMIDAMLDGARSAGLPSGSAGCGRRCRACCVEVRV